MFLCINYLTFVEPAVRNVDAQMYKEWVKNYPPLLNIVNGGKFYKIWSFIAVIYG